MVNEAGKKIALKIGFILVIISMLMLCLMTAFAIPLLADTKKGFDLDGKLL